MSGKSAVKKGFTLVELLVVISILAILSAIGFISYQTVIKSGRDGKRQSDLRIIQSALEQYHNDQGFYPTASGLDTALGGSPPPAFTSGIGNPSPPSPIKTYINALPQDPQASPQPRYKYEALPATPCDNSATKCTSYCLYAKMENVAPAKPPACTNSVYNFALTPP